MEPIALHSNLGSYYYVMLIVPRYARKRGLGFESIHDRCEFVN